MEETRSTGNDLLDALKERMNSPAFGTYIIFVMLLNWDNILLLLFSEQNVEIRLTTIKERTDVLWFYILPLALTVAYLISFPWITNAANLWRSYSNHKMMSWTVDFSSAVIAMQDQQARQTEITQQYGTLSELDEQYLKLNEKIEERKKELNEKRSELGGLEDTIRQVDSLAESDQVLQNLFGGESDETLSPETRELRAFHSEYRNEMINRSSLSSLSQSMHPELPSNTTLLKLILKDISLKKYKTLGDLIDAVDACKPFIEDYAKKNPTLFKYSSDYVSKSLGLFDSEFRENHNFGEETLTAFEYYGVTMAVKASLGDFQDNELKVVFLLQEEGLELDEIVSLIMYFRSATANPLKDWQTEVYEELEKRAFEGASINKIIVTLMK